VLPAAVLRALRGRAPEPCERRLEVAALALRAGGQRTDRENVSDLTETIDRRAELDWLLNRGDLQALCLRGIIVGGHRVGIRSHLCNRLMTIPLIVAILRALPDFEARRGESI
jgi:hypothetical protein